jgi:hypothetical protein
MAHNTSIWKKAQLQEIFKFKDKILATYFGWVTPTCFTKVILKKS